MRHFNTTIFFIFLSSILIFTLYSCSNSKQEQFKIKLNIDQLKPTSVYLEALGINEVILIDSTTSDSLGQIQFTGNFDEPQLFRIRVHNKGQMYLIIDSKEINIHANANNLLNYNITGSEYSKELSKFMKQIYQSNNAIIPLQLEKDGLMKSNQIDSLDITYLHNQIKVETDILAAFIKSNAEKTTSLNLALFYCNFLPMQEHAAYLKQFIAQLPNRFEQKKTIEQYKKEFYKHYNNNITAQPIINDQSLINTMAPDFTMHDMDGTAISLANFKGNYVILVFNASWNENSKIWNKSLQQLYNTFHTKNVSFISIGIESDKENWTNAVHNENLPWAQLSSCLGWDCPLAMDYKIISVPTTFLINPNGKIIAIDWTINEISEELKTNAQTKATPTVLTSL